jgi:hypothetical protein
MRDACSGENRGEEEFSAEDKDDTPAAATRKLVASDGSRPKRDDFLERGLKKRREKNRLIEGDYCRREEKARDSRISAIGGGISPPPGNESGPGEGCQGSSAATRRANRVLDSRRPAIRFFFRRRLHVQPPHIRKFPSRSSVLSSLHLLSKSLFSFLP